MGCRRVGATSLVRAMASPRARKRSIILDRTPASAIIVYIAFGLVRVRLILWQDVPRIGSIVDMVILVILGFGDSSGPHVEGLCLSQSGARRSGSGSSSSSLSFERGLFVLVGCLGLFEDIDDMFALEDEGDGHVSKVCAMCKLRLGALIRWASERDGGVRPVAKSRRGSSVRTLCDYTRRGTVQGGIYVHL